MSEFSKLLNQFAPIELSEMKDVELMNRVDTKFIFHKKHLPKVLNDLNTHYRILEIKSNRVSSYKNLYFDTEKLKFYNDHHNGKTNRIKIRIRRYIESEVCYLEVKQKNNKGRTTKKRMQLSDFEPNFSSDTEEFLNQYGVNAVDLNPVLSNEFQRVTLVSLVNEERITLDIGLSYKGDISSFTYEDLVIVELKQAAFDRSCPLFNILKSLHINPYRISKYCIGMAAMHKELKQNAFKEKMLKINKISG